MQDFRDSVAALRALCIAQDEKIATIVNRAKYYGISLTPYEKTECMRKTLSVEMKHSFYRTCTISATCYTNINNNGSYYGVCAGMEPNVVIDFVDERFKLTWETLKDLEEELTENRVWEKCTYKTHPHVQVELNTVLLGTIPCRPSVE